MRIARVKLDGNETYGFVKNGSISVRDEMIDNTGIPLPPEIKQFLFDGWFEEVVRKNPKLPYALKITDVKLLAPIPNPPKIICLAFNYAEHAKEQGLQSPKDPVPVMKPRTALCGSGAKIELADPVKDLDYEGELALIHARVARVNCTSLNCISRAETSLNTMYPNMAFFASSILTFLHLFPIINASSPS